MSLRKRLNLYLILFSVIPVLIVGGISAVLSRRNIVNNAITANTSVVNRVASDINNLLSSSFNAADQLEDSISNQEAMRLQTDDRNTIYQTELKSSLNMYVDAKYHPEIFGLYLIGKNGCSFKSSFCTFRNTDLRNEPLYQQAVSSREMTYLGSYTGSRLVSSLDYPMLAFGRAFLDKATGLSTGAVIMEMKKEVFEELLSFDSFADGYMGLVGADGLLLTGIGDQGVFDSYSAGNLLPGRYLCFTAPVSTMNCTVVRIIPVSYVENTAGSITIVILVICAALIVLTVAISWGLSGRITKPILTLIGLMHQVENGDLSVAFAPKLTDEIGMLFRSFNIMVEKTRALMESVEDEQKKLRTAEIRTLMNQINPHFLYNTLDSIVWLCRAGSTDKAAEMTEALAAFFRIGLSRGRDVISIEEELQHVTSYLRIQQIRGEHLLEYQIHADESLYHCRTVKFILQPLVENAIFHGLFKLRNKGQIVIEVYKDEEEGTIVFSVQDNGMGMTPDKCEKLRQVLEAGEIGSSESYGLINVNRRIRHFFGEQYGIRFFSVYGKGTSFEIVIPEVSEEDNV